MRLALLPVALAILLVPAPAASAATTATVCLVDSTGAGIEGGVASYSSGSWLSIGVTSPDGCVSTDAPSALGTRTFRIGYGGQTRYLTQDTTGNPTVTFQTTPVTVRLLDSRGGGLAGGVVSYAEGSWQTFGTTDATGAATRELLTGSTTFRMVYGGRSQQFVRDTVADNVVSFQTGRVLQGTGPEERHPLVTGQDGRTVRAEPVDDRADLEGVRPETPPGGHVQAVQRPVVHREVCGRRWAARSGLKMGVWSPVDVVAPWSVEAVLKSGAGSCAVGPSLLP